MPYSRICHLVYLLGQILFILHHQIDQRMCRDNEQRFKVKRQDHIRPRFKKSPLSIYSPFSQRGFRKIACLLPNVERTFKYPWNPEES